MSAQPWSHARDDRGWHVVVGLNKVFPVKFHDEETAADLAAALNAGNAARAARGVAKDIPKRAGEVH